MIETLEPLKKTRMAVQDDKLYVETTTYDDLILANNQAHRLNETFRRGDHVAFQPKRAEVIYVIQAPEPEWLRLKAKNPDLYQQLHSKSQPIREKAAAMLRRMHPTWFIESPRTFVPVQNAI